MKALDVRHINPFLQSTLSIMEQAACLKLAVGKPAVATLEFLDNTFIIPGNQKFVAKDYEVEEVLNRM